MVAETLDLFILPEPCCTLDISGAEEDRLVNMFKAIGNKHRFAIMKFMITHPVAITADLVRHLPIAQATVSQHLKVLREAGWVRICANRGPATYYCLDNKNITWFQNTVGDIF